MSGPTRARALAAALLVALAAAASGCRSITVDPTPPARPHVAPDARVPLGFALRWALDSDALRPSPAPSVVDLDGEDLAAVTAEVRRALERTGAFRRVERAQTAQHLHLALRVRTWFDAGSQLMLPVLTLGLAPDRHQSAFAITARASRPGRAPRTYTVHSRSVTWISPLLLPVGLVQLATQAEPLEQAVDALVAQLAADGWLVDGSARAP